ncbi:hypothetical protein DL96DRAFT_1581275 [Flagelloscypha sp. PMI_526]|nr:hypothetical protein DL96DRAFT_1630832 [Flagelloscypha sp. PMI_526]KAH8834681.1 hypothetical protein DL96DRAFT_1581275 [Flagelloscypha sp. PMI_526]
MEVEYAACLQAWFQLEASKKFQDNVKGFMDPRSYPQEISALVRSKAQRRIVVDGENFGARLCDWWNSSQPDVRKRAGSWKRIRLDDAEEFDRLLEDDDPKWMSFQVPGRKGFYLVIAGLSWWWSAVHENETELGRWKLMVEDVTFMMQVIERINIGA